MKTLIAALALLGAGCLGRNTISGQWTGCAEGDDIYVNVPSGHGPTEADHFACEEGGFEIGVGQEAFRLDLDRRDADYHFLETVSFDLVGVTADRDLGLIIF